MMTRRLARKNIRTGLIVAAICMFMFGITFVVAADLHLMSPLDPEMPPAGEEIHLPGPIDPPAADRGRHHADARRRDDLHRADGRRRGADGLVHRALDQRHAPRNQRAPARRPRLGGAVPRPRAGRLDRRQPAPQSGPTAPLTPLPPCPGPGRSPRPRSSSAPRRGPTGCPPSRPVEDDQVAEAPAHHRRGGLLQRPVRRGEDDVARQVIRDQLAVGILPGADRDAACRAR